MRSSKPFVVYCPQLNEIQVCENIYGMDIQIAIEMIRLGLKDKYTLEYIGEL